jgi:hypothetical protein
VKPQGADKTQPRLFGIDSDNHLSDRHQARGSYNGWPATNNAAAPTKMLLRVSSWASELGIGASLESYSY